MTPFEPCIEAMGRDALEPIASPLLPRPDIEGIAVPFWPAVNNPFDMIWARPVRDAGRYMCFGINELIDREPSCTAQIMMGEEMVANEEVEKPARRPCLVKAVLLPRDDVGKIAPGDFVAVPANNDVP